MRPARRFLAVLSAELLKLKRTLAIGIVVIAPILVVILYFLVGYVGAERLAARPRTDQWRQICQNTLGLWTILVLPMFVALETSLLAGLEHADRNWKSLLALPAPRWMIYLSKWLVAAAMLWAAHVVLVAGTFASGALLRALQPALQITTLTADPLVPGLLTISGTALLALTIQHWVSIRWQSFTVALGFGAAAMVVGFVMVNSVEWGSWFPWSMSMLALRPQPGQPDLRLVALLASAAVVAVGAWEFSRRDVTS